MWKYLGCCELAFGRQERVAHTSAWLRCRTVKQLLQLLGGSRRCGRSAVARGDPAAVAIARSLRVAGASAGVGPFGPGAAGDAARPALSRVLTGRGSSGAAPGPPARHQPACSFGL